ncbi:hypothetical protein ATANTOWER_021977 [Ataeniobius toweri]|uniref:Uncharacterized protein n=1 Tax=Ataeniobius toweri TaxID=208326 RepID=A0ABU7A7X2_9TELE|nr:hypothetical protein [Ataeniobius toweri]
MVRSGVLYASSVWEKMAVSAAAKGSTLCVLSPWSFDWLLWSDPHCSLLASLPFFPLFLFYSILQSVILFMVNSASEINPLVQSFTLQSSSQSKYSGLPTLYSKVSVIYEQEFGFIISFGFPE